jgi:orotidine-5'-phosphate decarboxylase
LDGVVCSPHEVRAIRGALGRSPVIVTPGIRAANSDVHDQVRVGDAQSTLSAGADYLVVGRALTDKADDPRAALRSLGFEPAA